MRVAFLLLFLSLIGSAAAQKANSKKDSIVGNHLIKIYPLPAFGYAPETRWYLGAVALFNLRFTKDTLEKPSAVKTEFNITQNKQWVATVNFDLRLKNDLFLLTGVNGYYKFPEDYWGIGADTKDADRVSYDAKRLEMDNSFLVRVFDKGYVGVRYRYHNMQVIDYDPDKNVETNFTTRYETGGVGVAMIVDNRDNVFNPRKGYYASASWLWFNNAFGGTYRYSRFDLDLRGYHSIHNKAILASQIVVASNNGAAPFRMLPLIGNESIMRGYYTGRYRDENMVAAQLEYRAVIWRWVGVAAFAGGATVFNSNTTDFNKALLPNYGLGLRIRVDKNDNINLRFDYGIGKNTDGFYVAFAEAF